MCHVCWLLLLLLLLFVQAYNMLAAQIEQHSSVGRKMGCKVLDVRDVDVRTHTHCDTHTCMHICTHTRAHAHTHAHTHTRTHTCTHAHTALSPFHPPLDCHGEGPGTRSGPHSHLLNPTTDDSAKCQRRDCGGWRG